MKLYFQTNSSGILHKTYDSALVCPGGQRVHYTILKCTGQSVAADGSISIVRDGPGGEFITDFPPDHKFILCRRCFKGFYDE